MIVGLQPTAWPSSPGVIEKQSQRWGLNPLRPLYKSGARPVEHRLLFQRFDLDSNQEHGLRGTG